MTNSHTKILVHAVWGVKHRRNLFDPAIKPRLERYLASTFRDLDAPAYEVGAAKSHVHILFDLPKTKAICDLIGKVKSRSSNWLKTIDEKLQDFAWQRGYGAYSVSQSAAPAVREYIANQWEHHNGCSLG